MAREIAVRILPTGSFEEAEYCDGFVLVCVVCLLPGTLFGSGEWTVLPTTLSRGKDRPRFMDNSTSRSLSNLSARRGPRVWEHLLALGLYTLCVFLLSRPFLGSGIWVAHDTRFTVVRVSCVIEHWKTFGPFYTPWLPDVCQGYGLPFFVFYPPFGYYVAAAAHFLFGCGPVSATAFSYLLAFYMAGISMYLLVWLWGRFERWPRMPWWAMGIATIYVFAPYHIADVFTRGSLAESWAWATLPFVFLGWRVCQERPLTGVLVTSISMNLLILSHNVMALYTVLFAGVFAILMFRSARGLLSFAAGGFLGCLLSAFYWFPALKHLPDVAARSVEVMWGTPDFLAQHAVYWRQYLMQTVGRGGSMPGPNDNMGINLGPVAVLAAALAFVSAVSPGVARRRRHETVVGLGLLLALLFIMSPQMSWQHVPATFRYLQFPWRLLVIATFFACLSLLLSLPRVNSWTHPLLLAGFATLVLLPAFAKLTPSLAGDNLVHEKEILEWYSTEEEKGNYAGAVVHEYCPRWVSSDFIQQDVLFQNPAPKNRLTVRQGALQVLEYRKQGVDYFWRYSAPSDVKASVHVFFFPGWQLRIDGKRASQCLCRDDRGLVKLKLPAGTHEVRLGFRGSGDAYRGLYITALGWFVWFALAAWLGWRAWKARNLSGGCSSRG
jgi:hypothetical protein